MCSEIIDHSCYSKIVAEISNDQLMPRKFYERGPYACEFDWDDVSEPITEDVENVERGCQLKMNHSHQGRPAAASGFARQK